MIKTKIIKKVEKFNYEVKMYTVVIKTRYENFIVLITVNKLM